jgi:hypothetical protein
MNAAILSSVLVAGVIGLMIGFGKRWMDGCLFACLAVPALSSTAFAVLLPAPTWWDKGAWGLMTFFYAFVCSFLVWGACAGANYGARRLHFKLTARSTSRHQQAVACRAGDRER